MFEIRSARLRPTAVVMPWVTPWLGARVRGYFSATRNDEVFMLLSVLRHLREIQELARSSLELDDLTDDLTGWLAPSTAWEDSP